MSRSLVYSDIALLEFLLETGGIWLLSSSLSAPSKMTDCQMEAAGLKAVQVPGFRPTCDSRGLYQAQQCFGNHCWCVNPANGEVIPGSLQQGGARCTVGLLPGEWR